MKFKQALIILLFAAGFVSCKKAIENATQQAVTNQITGGKWLVTSYVEGTTNVTSLYTGWEARFTGDGKFTSVKAGTSDTIRGIWSVDIFSQTFTGSYTSSSIPIPAHIQKIGATWKIVSADSTVGKYKRFDPTISDTARMTMNRY